ncbi:hypothetical protein [Falsirhodobacter sp. 20TX0035]|uniref:hypothetical protein n=1 Tax=Falsirhodobacter sp. 20TX0035 TaxID=3022019 RepID=UPI00232AA6BE|nr:hypothetical protein [Falsirhodobacter sp. 20TX0035]MDB6452463.1 hypothetical protein [Falsirhodobacter sp. 20TX0035]
MLWTLGAIGGLSISAISFVAGRVFSQSEAILADKRRVYEKFLVSCPVPNDVYLLEDDPERLKRMKNFQDAYQTMLLYAAPSVVIAVSIYLEKFAAADAAISPNTAPLHTSFKSASVAHNDVILEMRRDGLAWSAFGHRGKTRLPVDALEQAKRKIQ